ncbi:MAG TPA: AAA family ATPase [Chloroflexia bacterium]|nr:AAA family ATPase [Chloroflexia bacterium]
MISDDGPSDSQAVPFRAWWLTTRRRRAEWQSLLATGAATFTGRPRAHFNTARPGDPVFLYISKPDHAILAVATIADISSSVPSNDQQVAIPDPRPPIPDAQLEVQLAFEVPNALTWRDIASEPELAGSEPVRQRSSGTLFPLSEREYSALQLLIMERNPELASAFSALDTGKLVAGKSHIVESDESDSVQLHETRTVYKPARTDGVLPPVRNLAELQQLTGLSCEMLEEARDLLEDVGQIVLSGPPGAGKTWLARGLGTLAAGDPSRVQVVQFHPSTTYEDFIEGLKPRVDHAGGVIYAVVPGIFVRLCEAARYDPEHHYVLVIDEINRAPLARVFGELLYALEYRGPQGGVHLSLSGSMGESNDLFYVPENVLIVGTMNTADRSLASIDHALRRRFRFIEMEPDESVLDRWLLENGASESNRRAVLKLLERANARLSEMLDPDHRLGHTYFMLDPLGATTLDRLWRTAIKPLLAEYFISPAGELEEFRLLFAEAGAAMREE